MDHLRATIRFMKNTISGERSSEKTSESDESFSPYDLLRDFDVKSFVEEVYAKIYEQDPDARDALLWGVNEIKSMSDKKLFELVVENYFESDEDLYEFAIEYARKVGKPFPSWWNSMVKPKSEKD